MEAFSTTSEQNSRSIFVLCLFFLGFVEGLFCIVWLLAIPGFTDTGI
jgi:hypothetical protein